MTSRYCDALVHATPDGRWFDTPFDASESRLFRELDAAGVERAVLVGIAGFIDNAFVADVCRRSGGRLVAGAGFDPTIDGEPAARARTEIRDGGFGIVKLHPRMNRYDPLDARVLAFLDEIAGWPQPPAIWLDTLIYPRGIPLQMTMPESIRTLAERYPSLTFVCLHAGGAHALALFDAVRVCPNVFIDLSYSLVQYAHASIARDHRFLVERFEKRTVFGSDFPEIGIADAVACFEALAAGLPDDKAQAVRSGTLQRILSAL